MDFCIKFYFKSVKKGRIQSCGYIFQCIHHKNEKFVRVSQAMLPLKKALGSHPEATGVRASLVKYKGDLSVALAEATATATKRYILCRDFHSEYGMSRAVVFSVTMYTVLKRRSICLYNMQAMENRLPILCDRNDSQKHSTSFAKYIARNPPPS